MVVDYITAALVGHIAGIESSICTSDVVDCQRGPPNVVVTGSVIHENVSACAGLKTKETPLGDPDSWVGGVSTLQGYIRANRLFQCDSLCGDDGRAWS